MRFRRAFAFVLFTVILLTACGKSSLPEPSEAYWTNGRMTTRTDGLYTVDYDGLLTYVDYQSGISVPVCPRPNCDHSDPETCSARFKTGLGKGAVIPYGEKIYWFENDIVNENGKFTESATLYSAAKYGGDIVQVAKLENRNLHSTMMMIYDGKLWFIADEQVYNEHGSTNEDTTFLYTYDFEKGKFKELYNFGKEHPDSESSDAMILGMWNGKLIVQVYQYYEYIGDDLKYNEALDLSGFKPEVFDFWVSGLFDGKIYGDNGENLIVLSDSGERFEVSVLKDIKYRSWMFAGDYFVYPTEGIAIDYRTGKKYEWLLDVYSYIAGSDGEEYIVAGSVFDEQEKNRVVGTKYSRVGRSELIGAEQE